MKDLSKIIKDNPSAVATIDNDWWQLDIPAPKGLPDEAWDDWQDNPRNRLADSADEFKHDRGLGYVQGQLYGGDLLIVLAEMQGLKLEAV